VRLGSAWFFSSLLCQASLHSALPKDNAVFPAMFHPALMADSGWIRYQFRSSAGTVSALGSLMLDADVRRRLQWIRIGQYENSFDYTSWDWIEQKRGVYASSPLLEDAVDSLVDDGIVVERRLNSGTEGGRGWHQFAKLSANADQYIDTGVNAQSVDYRVHAINANGSSAYSNVVRTLTK
jgi:hypothetical protein